MLLNEWLPNPAGTDSGAEWVELLNDSDSATDLLGWRIVSGKKQVVLSERLVPPRATTLLLASDLKSLTLVNQDGTLTLLDPAGRSVSAANFLGAAPENLSFGRLDGQFVFMPPTPNAPNRPLSAPSFRPLAHEPFDAAGNYLMFGGALLVGLLLAVSAVWLVRWSHVDRNPLAERN